MAVTGVHTLFHTSKPDEVRTILSEVFGWDHIDSGGGWLIFAMPPSEMGVHPADQPSHQISFMCDDLTATIAELEAKGIAFIGEPTDEGFGIVARMMFPGDLEVQLYEPRHETAI